MLNSKPSPLSAIQKIIISLLVLSFLVSCKSSDTHYSLPTKVKKAPKKKPFVYKTNIKLYGDLSKAEKANLQSKLAVQLEDSVNPRASQKIFWQVIKRPPVFDTAYVNQSKRFMDALLYSNGYFHHTVTWDTLMKYDGDEYRTILNFNVTPGPVTILDSVWYNINQPELQKLADSSRIDTARKKKDTTATYGIRQPFQQLADSTSKETFLKKGSTFNQDTIGMELDRLVELYRNNGYLRFTRNELAAVWDTLDALILQPNLDISDQIKLLTALAERQKHPTANLEIRLRPGYDTARLVKYYVGNIVVYPDFGPDSSEYKTVVLDSTYTIKYHQNLFKPKIIPQNIFFSRGEVYNQNKYLITVNRFNQLIAWRLVNVEQKPRLGSDTVDFNIKLSPARKYLFSADIEGSQNVNRVLFANGNLLGIGLNVSLQNKNFARVAAQTNTTLRYGTELNIINKNSNRPTAGNKLLISRQASIGYNIFFPRWVPPGIDPFPKFGLKEKLKGKKQSVFAFNLANTQRIDLYNLTSFNASGSYRVEYKNQLYALKFPNIEYSFLDAKQGLKDIFALHPGLKNIFNDGLVTSEILSYTNNWGTKKNINTVIGNTEISGLPTFSHSNFIRKNLYRFIKVDGEYKRLMKTSKTSELVARVFAGVGNPVPIRYNGTQRSQYLPFFKAYVAGGPNSMRGWGIRKLGPGASVVDFDSIPDRFGDIQFETNLEYRFHAFDAFGFHINSALYTDIGNVWFNKPNPDFPNGEFKPNRFLSDLAVDVGTGLRVDLGFFLIRLDYAFKVKNPTPGKAEIASQKKWFYGWGLHTLWSGLLQFGVTYPF